jgi:hypothetical protein
MKSILFILSFLLGVAGLSAQVSVSASLDSTSIMIGDQVNITLTMTCDPAVKLGDPDISALDTVKALEIINISNLNEIRKSKTGTLYQQKITLTSFTEGAYNIPQIGIPFEKKGNKGNVFSPTLLLEVNTFDVSEATELQPIKNIIEEPFSFWDLLPYLIIGLALLVIGLTIWLLIRRNQRRETMAEFKKKKLPPHIIALNKLEKLHQAELWQQGEIKSFQSQLTFILREYLEERFKIPALESTSDEIIDDLKKTDLDAERTNNLKDILQTADLVKFAKSEPPVDVHDKAFRNIVTFVKETIPATPQENDKENTSSIATGNSSND